MTDIFSRLPSLLLPWYRQNHRQLPWRETKEPYRIWLSEIMLQQTRVEAVKGYYARFLEALPTVQALAAAPEEQLLKLWEGLGYYNRARNLQKAAKIVAETGFPDTYEGLLALPGVGEYTAGAVASICFDRPVAAVDGNVLRVVTRLTADPSDITRQETKRRMAAELKAKKKALTKRNAPIKGKKVVSVSGAGEDRFDATDQIQAFFFESHQ